jgi:hypothetical protein
MVVTQEIFVVELELESKFLFHHARIFKHTCSLFGIKAPQFCFPRQSQELPTSDSVKEDSLKLPIQKHSLW